MDEGLPAASGTSSNSISRSVDVDAGICSGTLHHSSNPRCRCYWQGCLSVGQLQGSDCVAPFKAMQQCMVEHPQAFAEYVQAKDADSEQKASAIEVLRTDQ